MTLLSPALASLANAVFPASCALCGAESGDVRSLCGDCWREVGFLQPGGCVHCGRPLPGGLPEVDEPCEDCRVARPAWSRGTAVFRYDDTGRKIILSLKHGDRQDLLPMLAGWAARKADFLLREADIVAPIPLHWTRRLKRRTNQAADLCRHLVGGRTHRRLEYAPRLLVRTRSTGNQGGKDRPARIANVEGAFAPGSATAISGRRVLLVDDVMTTGATLNEAAKILRTHGAAGVDILVLALVMRDDAPYMGTPENGENDEAD